MTERISVSCFRVPRTRRRWPWTGMVAPIRPRNLLWLAVLLAVPVASRHWGTPHLLLFESSTGTGAIRFYTDCAYLGLDFNVIHLGGSSCPLVRLLKTNGD